MQSNKNQQYDYQKVHQVTPEELQKTLVLNLEDFENTARIEKMTSKKPAITVALLGVLSIALGIGFPFIQSFTARNNADKTIVENRKEYDIEEKEEDEEEINNSEETVLCNLAKTEDDGTDVTSVVELKFRDGGIVAFTRTTTINPTPGNGLGPSTIKAINDVLEPLLTQVNGYKVSVKQTLEGGTEITTDVNYDLLDFTTFPQKQQTHYTTSIDYASNTPKEQVVTDMETKEFTCE